MLSERANVRRVDEIPVVGAVVIDKELQEFRHWKVSEEYINNMKMEKNVVPWSFYARVPLCAFRLAVQALDHI